MIPSKQHSETDPPSNNRYWGHQNYVLQGAGATLTTSQSVPQSASLPKRYALHLILIVSQFDYLNQKELQHETGHVYIFMDLRGFVRMDVVPSHSNTNEVQFQVKSDPENSPIVHVNRQRSLQKPSGEDATGESRKTGALQMGRGGRGGHRSHTPSGRRRRDILVKF